MSNLIKFLLGEGEYEGAWFGEKAKQEKGAYWWRKYLRKYTEDQASEIEQLKAQNMAMSAVVDAAVRWDSEYVGGDVEDLENNLIDAVANLKNEMEKG